MTEQAHPHWHVGAKVMRKGGNFANVEIVDETWQNWNGVGFFNRVRWEGSQRTTTVRADRLKPAQEQQG